MERLLGFRRKTVKRVISHDLASGLLLKNFLGIILRSSLVLPNFLSEQLTAAAATTTTTMTTTMTTSAL